MNRIATIHQPNYLPWIGLFSKVMQTNCLIIADVFQYMPIVRRNKIRTVYGSSYLTIPVGAHLTSARILEVPLPKDSRWQREHWREIYRNYQKSPYFEEYKGYLESIYQRDYRFLWQINLEIIIYLMRCFNIKVEIILASDLNLDPELKHTDTLIDILKKAGASTYISGPSGKDYLEVEKFSQNGIGLKFFKFQHPVYQQRYPGFESNLSAIDLLFNMGPRSSELIKSAGTVEEIACLTV